MKHTIQAAQYNKNTCRLHTFYCVRLDALSSADHKHHDCIKWKLKTNFIGSSNYYFFISILYVPTNRTLDNYKCCIILDGNYVEQTYNHIEKINEIFYLFVRSKTYGTRCVYSFGIIYTYFLVGSYIVPMWIKISACCISYSTLLLTTLSFILILSEIRNILFDIMLLLMWKIKKRYIYL